MGRKSRLKKERQLYQPPQIISELIKDYLAAEAKLTVDTPRVLFRGKMTTGDALFGRLFEEAEKLGLGEGDIINGWAQVKKIFLALSSVPLLFPPKLSRFTLPATLHSLA